MRYRFIHAEKANFAVRLLCKVMEVSRSGYYAWRGRGPSPRSLENEALLAHIGVIHAASRSAYGSPRVHAELVAERRCCGENRTARLMRRAGLRAKQKRRYRVTTNSNHTKPVAANLLSRRFDVAAPDRVWCSDITYLATAEGWLYLAATMELASRRILGWSLSERMDTTLVLAALQMALGQRAPQSGALLHHSDRGSQYASEKFQNLLARHQITCSMSRKGDCWDNAVMESFFGTLKTELTHHERYQSRAQARASVFEYIEVFYNRKRRHSSLGYRSPVDYEKQMFQS